jgi:hypothetical protein
MMGIFTLQKKANSVITFYFKKEGFMNPVNFVINLISIGLGLLCAGTLVEVLVDLEKKAAHDTEIGIVSVGEWNRQLFGENPCGTGHHKTSKK